MGEALTVYVDNSATLAALLKWDPSVADSLPIATAWIIADTRNISIWFGRVGSNRNAPGLPTWARPVPIPVDATQPFPHMGDGAYFYGRNVSSLAPAVRELEQRPPALPPPIGACLPGRNDN